MVHFFLLFHLERFDPSVNFFHDPEKSRFFEEKEGKNKHFLLLLFFFIPTLGNGVPDIFVVESPSSTIQSKEAADDGDTTAEA